ncbi:DMT family transporter [Bacillus manliponensis]|uniref:DMT family transporter n=1 Tax=Bacillus manliponensis TaxID=574376 RepID=UPI00068A7055|nr:DMT family transporter [Bacillus manliponensis]
MKKKYYILGILFAVVAALLNGTVGVFSKGIMSSNMSPSGIAFYKCLIAFTCISLIAVFHKNTRERIKENARYVKPIMFCAFLGIFILYFFETTGYKYQSVPLVVFILLGSATLTTFFGSMYFLAEKKQIHQYIGLLLLFLGLFFMFFYGESESGSLFGMICAAIAGIGYGLFMIFTKRYQLKGSLGLVWYLMLFGSIYLFIPFAIEGLTIPAPESYGSFILLAILPTIGGFYCTTVALNYIEASKVQFFELTEPVFATVFAFVFLREFISGAEWIGASLILVAIYISEYERKQVKQVEDEISY